MGPDLTVNDGGGPKDAVNSSSSNSQAFLGNKPNDLPDPNAEDKHIDTDIQLSQLSQEKASSTQSAVESKLGSIAFEILALVCFLERSNVIVFAKGKFYCVQSRMQPIQFTTLFIRTNNKLSKFKTTTGRQYYSATFIRLGGGAQSFEESEPIEGVLSPDGERSCLFTWGPLDDPANTITISLLNEASSCPSSDLWPEGHAALSK